ncbi:CCN family member 5 [Macrosteles quadrilineatus]|uniref:CCN family member 5 n=1 Tax=Macrosteles quadrilineatus TaxID=74068 RepID=UPI0023E12603|nr:CCN family member 5 [Macrosteles quadrilineatus]
MEIVVVLVLLLGTLLDGQRAPCYECEDYKDDHPLSSPYNEIRSHCSYPCVCPPGLPRCDPGVPVVRDGCGCCPMCARQVGQPCDGTALCDESRGLVCQYANSKTTVGICKAIKGKPCTIYNQTYDNGETFMLDCRTQCACKNGTYACASLCPQENISPRGSCRHPRLVEVPGQCCREWMCDGESVQSPPQCLAEFSPWTPCSSSCGLGLSHRVSNLNPDCKTRNETRLCQLRPCDSLKVKPLNLSHHHVRKGHECKATHRMSRVHLVFGQCRSRKRYRPRACGECGGCCAPELSSTVRVEFVCGVTSGLEDVELGSDLWRSEAPVHGHRHVLSVDVEWVLKCQCNPVCLAKGVTRPPLLHRVHRTAPP